MSANPAGNSGQLTVPLRLPDFHKHAQPVDPAERGAGTGEATRVLGEWLAGVIRDNPDNFRIFGPDETASNALSAVFEASGRRWMDPIDPVHLIFLLWGSTQHYADFATQICRVTGRTKLTKQDMEDAGTNLIHIILKGCGIKPAL